MPKLLLIALSLAFALALSSCASTGRDALPPPVCPQPSPPPASLMTPPDFGQKVRALLFDSPTSATPKSADSRPW